MTNIITDPERNIFFKTSSRLNQLNNSFSKSLILKIIPSSIEEAFYELYFNSNPNAVTEMYELVRVFDEK
jgi:hypothetical protein